MESEHQMNGISINISYNAFYNNHDLEDFKGITELKRELSNCYVSRIKGTPVGRGGGGVYEFVIDLIMNTSLEEFTKLLLDGLAFDLIKSNTKKFILKPFIKAFEDFNEKNGGQVTIREFKFQFENSEVVIRSVNDQGVYTITPLVFEKIAKVYSVLFDPISKKYPNRICVPVIYDQILTKNESIHFRELLTDENEYLHNNLSPTQYFDFWGLNYEFNNTQSEVVYDVANSSLTVNEFFSGDIFERFILSKLDIKFE